MGLASVSGLVVSILAISLVASVICFYIAYYVVGNYSDYRKILGIISKILKKRKVFCIFFGYRLAMLYLWNGKNLILINMKRPLRNQCYLKLRHSPEKGNPYSREFISMPKNISVFPDKSLEYGSPPSRGRRMGALKKRSSIVVSIMHSK